MALRITLDAAVFVILTVAHLFVVISVSLLTPTFPVALAFAETQGSERHPSLDRVAGEMAADGLFQETPGSRGRGGPS